MMALNAYVRSYERPQTSDGNLHYKKLEAEQIKTKVNSTEEKSIMPHQFPKPPP